MSPLLVVALIVILVGIAAFFVYKFALTSTSEQDGAAAGSDVSATVPAPPTAGSSAATPITLVAAVAIDSLPALDIMAPVGEIESVEPEGKAVKAGDIVAMMAGRK